MPSGLKHFTVVGLGFALVVGWVLTLIVNGVVSWALSALIREPPEKYYFASVVLTVVSISLICLCIIFGNRVFRHWFQSGPFPFSSLLISTGLFLIVVLVFVVPQLSEVLGRYADHTHYFYSHSSELVLMLSLPVARLIVLPAAYFVISRSGLRGTPSS